MGQIKNIKLHIVTDIKNNTKLSIMSLVVPEKFQHILRVMNTNIDGKTKIMYAMTSIKGVGRRFSNICLKKADIDMNKRAGIYRVLILDIHSQSPGHIFVVRHCHSP